MATFVHTNYLQDNLYPEAVIRIQCEDGRLPEADCADQPLLRLEVSAEALANVNGSADLATQRAAIRGTVQTRFPANDPLFSDMVHFHAALEAYQASQTLGCEFSRYDIDTLLRVTDLSVEDVPVLASKSDTECEAGFAIGSDRHDQYLADRKAVQDALWGEAGRLSSRVIAGDVVGLSTGFADFFRDVWWILLLAGSVLFAPRLLGSSWAE